MATLFEGYGTRVKIIESLILQSNVISTSKGIEGIDFYPKKKIIITNQKKKIVDAVYYFMQLKNNKLKNLTQRLSKYYSMENNANLLYKDIC